MIFHEGDTASLRRVRLPDDAGFDDPNRHTDDYPAFIVKATRAFRLPYLYSLKSINYLPPAVLGSLTRIRSDKYLDDEYQKLLEVVSPSDFSPSRGGRDSIHHIGGHIFTQHELPEQQAAAAMGGEPQDWYCLLCLGFDNNTKFCFWDAGSLFFMIQKGDLRERRFDRISAELNRFELSTFQCANFGEGDAVSIERTPSESLRAYDKQDFASHVASEDRV